MAFILLGLVGSDQAVAEGDRPDGSDSVVVQGRIAAATPSQTGSNERAPESSPTWDEYTNSFEGIPGRGSRQLFDLPIPHAGLYQVHWQAEVYSLDPRAALSGVCSVVDDPVKNFYYDAAPYDPETPASGFTSNDGSTPAYIYRKVGGGFLAYLGAGADLILRCISGQAAPGAAPVFDKILSASLFARKQD